MGVTLFISCLGVLGLSLFTTGQKRKEIGVRKVLGATVSSIVVLLNKELLILVGMAVLLASPLAWYVLQQWLANFAYRISIQWWSFGVAGATMLLLALLTTAFQALKAAQANPVDSLRQE